MHVRCPYCHNPIEILDGAELSDIECPSCGSSFDLLLDETCNYQKSESRSIGHFQLIDQVGVGAFGSVWKAHDKQLDRTVEVKIPRKGQLSAAETEQFLREARSVAQLKHPYIVPVHEVGRDEGQVYIVSDFIEGLTLSSWLTGRHPTTSEAAKLCVGISQALQHAHDAGVVHRDLKPSNIILDSAGNPHIMDFGLAKREAGEITVTLEGNVLGTPAYMSPEQATGKAHAADGRSDVYSLGVILFELMTGEKPFRGDYRMLIHQVINDEPPSPRKLKSSVPRDLDTICLKCLEKDPDSRYQTAGNLADDLTRHLNGEPISARPVSSSARVWRWCRRNPTIAILNSTVLLLLLLIAVVAVHGTIAVNAERNTALRNEKTAIAAARAAKRQEERANNEQQLAKRERQAAVSAQKAAVQRLIRLQLSNGANLLAAGDASASLLWFTEAMAAAEASGFSQDVHRLRAANVASACPRLLAVFGDMSFRDLDRISHDGRYRLVLTKLDPEEFKGITSQEEIYERASRIPAEATVWDNHIDQPVGQPIKLSQSIVELGGYMSPDGGQFVTESPTDFTVQVWDTKTSKPVSPLIKHGDLAPNSFVLFSTLLSPDGRFLITSADGQSRVCEVTSGSVVAELPPSENVKFSPTGEQIATYGSDGARVWNTIDGQAITPLLKSGHEVTGVAFSPDGQRLATSSETRSSDDRSVWIWNVPSGEPLISGLPKGGWMEEVHSFSPDGSHIVTTAYPNAARVWNATTGEPVTAVLEHNNTVEHAAFSPNGTHVVTASRDGTAKVWKIEQKLDASIPLKAELANSPLRHATDVRQSRFLSDGKGLLTGGLDDIRRWDLPASSSATIPRASVAFSRDGRRVVALHRGGALKLLARRPDLVTLEPHLRDLESGKVVAQYSNELTSDEMQPGWLSDRGDRLLTVTTNRSEEDRRKINSTFQLWNAVTGETISDSVSQQGAPNFISASPDGNRFAVVTRKTPSAIARIHDLDGGDAIELPGKRPLIDARFSPDGQRIALVGLGRFEIRSAVNGDLIGQPKRLGTGGSGGGTRGFSRYIDYTSDGKYFAVTCGNNLVQVWNLRDVQPVSPIITHRDRVVHITFSPDGRYLATASRDGTARVWDSLTGSAVSQWFKHEQSIRYVSFSPEGRLVVTAGQDNTVRVWEVSTGVPVLPPLTHQSSVTYVAFTPNGRRIVASSLSTVSIHEIIDLQKPVEDANRMAEVLAGGHRLDATGSLTPSSSLVLEQELEDLREKYPTDFATDQ